MRISSLRAHDPTKLFMNSTHSIKKQEIIELEKYEQANSRKYNHHFYTLRLPV